MVISEQKAVIIQIHLGDPVQDPGLVHAGLLLY